MKIIREIYNQIKSLIFRKSVLIVEVDNIIEAELLSETESEIDNKTESEIERDLGEIKECFPQKMNERKRKFYPSNQFNRDLRICIACSYRRNRQTKTIHILERKFLGNLVWKCIDTYKH